MMAAMYDQLTKASPTPNAPVAPRDVEARNWSLHGVVGEVRQKVSSPSVMTAMENSGLPTIGRMARRSMTRPSSGAERQRDDHAEGPGDPIRSTDVHQSGSGWS